MCYNGKAVTAFYFKNLFVSKKIEIQNELEMKNMQIRGEPIGVTTIELSLLPNEGKLIIVDAIERD